MIIMLRVFIALRFRLDKPEVVGPWPVNGEAWKPFDISVEASGAAMRGKGGGVTTGGAPIGVGGGELG